MGSAPAVAALVSPLRTGCGLTAALCGMIRAHATGAHVVLRPCTLSAARLMPLSAAIDSGAGTATSSARKNTPRLASTSSACWRRSCWRQAGAQWPRVSGWERRGGAQLARLHARASLPPAMHAAALRVHLAQAKQRTSSSAASCARRFCRASSSRAACRAAARSATSRSFSAFCRALSRFCLPRSSSFFWLRSRSPCDSAIAGTFGRLGPAVGKSEFGVHRT